MQAPRPYTGIPGRRAILSGLLPLLFFAGAILLTLIALVLVRLAISASNFVVQQQTELIVLIVGSILAIVIYALSTRFVLRRAARWQQMGAVGHARLVYWLLICSALLVAIPVILTVLLPQHPAP